MKKLLLTLFCLISLININAQTVITIGTGTTVSGTQESSPINIWFKSHHCRIIYTASELNAAGWSGPSTITKLGFNIFGSPSEALPDFQISLKNTSATTTSNYDNGSLTSVYYSSSHFPTAGGFELITLDSPFNWDGVSNLLMDVCFSPVTTYSAVGQVYTYNYSAASSQYNSIRSDGASQCGIATLDSNTVYKPQLQLEMNPLAACSGSPIPGSAVVSDVCTSITAFTLSLDNPPVAAGITYQWQSSSDAINWNNMGTAQASHPYVVSSLSASTYFRCVSTCTNGGFPSASSHVLVHPNPAMNCHCKPTWSGFNIDCNSDRIVDFSLSNLINQPSNCIWPGYSDSTASNSQITLTQGIGYNLSLNTLVSGSNGDATVGAWIDFDQNGTFDTNEFTQVGLGQTGNYQASINVPLNAILGTTRMRLMMDAYNATAGTILNPCTANAGNLGQILDYKVNIVLPPACSGVPNTPTATTTETLACANASFSLSLSGNDVNSGLLYQWYSSPNGSVWNPLGASSTYFEYAIASQTAATYYQCVVTCTNSALTATTTPIFVNQKPIADCLCTPSYLECGSGDNFTTINFLSVTDNLSCVAGENGYSDHTQSTVTSTITAGQTFTIDMTYSNGSTEPAYISAWIDDNQNGFFEQIEQRVLAVALESASALTGSVTVPFYAKGGLTRMRLKLETQWSNLTQDPCITNGYNGHAADYYLQVIPATPCSGAPTVGNAVSTSSTVCANNSYTLNLSGNEETGNLSFQWQSSADGASWANEGSAQSNVSYIVTSQSSTTHYRCIATCLNSSLSSTSTPVVVNQTPLINCFCTPDSSDCTNDNIVNVTFEGINNNSACSAAGYGDYTGSVASATVYAGQTYSISTTISNDFYEYTSVWIDYNQNGVFDSSEHKEIGAAAEGTFTIIGSLDIPVNAVTGLTRMRVRTFNNSPLDPTQACINPNLGKSANSMPLTALGETEDYLVTILPPNCSLVNLPPSVAVTGSLDICPGDSTVLDAGTTIPDASGLTYQWKYFDGASYVNYGTASASSSNTMLPSINTFYFCEILCNGSPVKNSDTVLVRVRNISTSPVITNPTCFGACNGSVVLNASSSGSTLTYNWLPSGATTDMATNLCAGIFTINMVNGFGCTATETIAVIEPSSINVISTTTNVSCFGYNNGVAEVNVTGGTPTYSYNWNTGGITSLITSLSPGTYTCIINDANGCSKTQSVTITEPAALSAISSQTNVTCFGGNDGIAAVTPTGGTMPYNYFWSGGFGSVGNTINGATAQSYTCTITDNNLCSYDQIITLNEGQLILLSLAGDNNLCQNSTTSYSASVTNAIGATTYTWVSQPSGASAVNTIFDYTATAVGTESIYVSVTVANGCMQTSAPYTININPSTNISGTVLTATTGAVVSGSVTLYKYEPFFTKFDSISTLTLNASGGYTFSSIPEGTYIVKAIPSSSSLQITYGNSEANWKTAHQVSQGCAADAVENINVIPLSTFTTTGTGRLSGRIVQGAGYDSTHRINPIFNPMAPGNPIGGVIVKGGKNPGGQMFVQTTTGSDGTYTLDGLPPNDPLNPSEHYFILVDIPGLDTNSTYHVKITLSNTNIDSLNFIVDSAKINPTHTDVSVHDLNVKVHELKVFPNPAYDYLNIDYTLISKSIVKIEMLNIIGKNVKTILPETEEYIDKHKVKVDLKDLVSGVYFIRININNQESIIKLIKTE